MNQHAIPLVWREHALHPALHRTMLPAGLSIAEIVARTPDLPPWFMQHGEVTWGGVIVPREAWHRVRPKYDPCGRNVMHLHLPLQGGGSGGIIRTVAMIAVVVAAVAVSGGALGPAGLGLLGAEFAAGAFGATALGAAISIGGSLAVAALTPPPTLDPTGLGGGNAGLEQASGGTASLSGNVLRPGGSLPRVIGTHRVYPPLACHPLVEIVDDDEYVEAVFVLAGPHQIENVRNGDTPIDDIDELEYETREGFDADTALTLVTRQSRTDQPSLEFTEHVLKENDPDALDDQSTPLNSVPQWHSFVSRGSPDEIWFAIGAPRGLLDTANPTRKLGLPVRARLRAVGDTAWIQIPEFHLQHTGGAPFQKALKFMFQAAPGSPPTPLTDKAPYAAFKAVPMRVDQTIGNMNSRPNAFNGEVTGTTASSIGSTPAWIGADWRVHPRKLTYFEFWPRSDLGFVDGGAGTLTTLKVYGKTGSTSPSSSTDGTLLFTYSGGETTSPVTGVPSDTATEWSFVWAELIWSGSTVYMLEARFFDDGEFSWIANSYFSTGAGDDYLNAASIATSNIQNIALYYDRVEVYLDTGTFPKGDYEIQIMRGSTYNVNAFTVATYAGTMAGEPSPGSTSWVMDLFKWGYGTGVDSIYHVWEDLDRVYQTLNLTRMSRIWNEAVMNAPLAAIAVRGKNRRIENVNCDASGYVNKWNGVDAWDDLDISSNPADHYRDVLVGDLNASALPEDLVDDTNLVDWRDHCVTMGYEANMVCEGRSAFEVMNAVAGCGYARPRQSETWGVIMDRDRSADDPVQVFSPANMRGFRWEKAFNRLPAGFRVRYDESSENYQEQEIIVLRAGAVDDGRYEDIRYDGLVTEAEAEARAQFDLAQMGARSAFYRGEAPLEWIVAQRGDLVGVQYDVIDNYAGWARIKEVLTSGSNITGLVFNGSVPRARAFFIDTGGEDFFTESGGEDFFTRTMGVAIRCKDGTLQVEAVTPPLAEETDTVDFETPFANPGTSVIDADCLVVSGELGTEFKRMIVNDIAPKKGFTAMITFVDEAPELHA